MFHAVHHNEISLGRYQQRRERRESQPADREKPQIGTDVIQSALEIFLVDQLVNAAQGYRVWRHDSIAHCQTADQHHGRFAPELVRF